MKKYLIIALGLVLLSALIYNYKINTPAGSKAENVSFTVASGAGVKKIGAELAAAGLIKSKLFFELYVWKNDLDAKLKAGEFILSPNLSIKEIVKQLISGRPFGEEKTITVIEGWNLNDIGKYFESENLFTVEEFSKLAGYPRLDYRFEKKFSKPMDFSADYDFLKDKPDYVGLEGYLFPDTYRIFKDASLEDVVKKMLANFDKKLTAEMRADIKKQNKNIYEIITMASIVEKEVRSQTDMKIVAGIFWDRIKNGQALESCATLAYVLGENKKQYTVEDTKIDSPYNTYKNRDLPPGPIANPGLNAIQAAIYPEYTNYNYFLSRPDTGETVFSATYEEHVRNKAKYLR